MTNAGVPVTAIRFDTENTDQSRSESLQPDESFIRVCLCNLQNEASEQTSVYEAERRSRVCEQEQRLTRVKSTVSELQHKSAFH